VLQKIRAGGLGQSVLLESIAHLMQFSGDLKNRQKSFEESGVAQPQTIFALSTVTGRAALAVVRVSGAACDAVLAALGIDKVPTLRQAAVRKIYHPDTGALLDEALVLRFAAPHSYTGEDMAELHVHGGLAVTQSVLAALGSLTTRGLCRAAEAGEFTRRAVGNGKMDLTRAEAIADLIDAEGGAQQAQALKQMQGALRDLFEDWRERLKTMLAHLEADLEFADEELPGGLGQSVLAALPDLRTAMQAQLDDRRGVSLRDGLRIALLGPPNAGKSSILNMLAGREAAIVSARAGTTRDVIEVAMLLSGVPVTLVDTAGLREAGDDIEREGVRRARAQAERADINILVASIDTQNLDAHIGVDLRVDLRLANKADLGLPEGVFDLTFSAHDEAAAQPLLRALGDLVTARAGQSEAPLLTRERHRQVLGEAVAHLTRAEAAGMAGLELVAEDLRLAQRVLGRVTGAVDVEQLLDIVFADFCIGK
jgi:tRNA modification GTPase